MQRRLQALLDRPEVAADARERPAGAKHVRAALCPDVRFILGGRPLSSGPRRGRRAARAHEEATRHLDAAGELFARHGAKLYLDQVIARKEILKA